MTNADGRAGGAAELRIGLIGAGKMGLQHVKAITAQAGTRVIGVADPAADPARLAESLPAGCQVVKTAAELIALRPDVVHIVTPPATPHGAGAAGDSRPAATSTSRSRSRRRAPTRRRSSPLAAERGRLVCAGHQYLFEGPSLAVLESLAAIGDVVHVESYFSFRTVRRTITPVDQAKDILPHAVYPLVEQLRAGTAPATTPIAITGLDVRASGDVYALVRLGEATGVLLVTLNGRPIEQYQHIVGTNGSLRADYITGARDAAGRPGRRPRRALHAVPPRVADADRRDRAASTRLIFKRKTSYPGLLTIFERFYDSIRHGTPPPLSPQSILDTVDLCERIGAALDRGRGAGRRSGARAAGRGRGADRAARSGAPARARHRRHRPARHPARRASCVTPGSASACWRGGRRASASRVPGVEYVVADLARPLDPAVMAGVGFVVHCAAETAGGKDDHERNSIDATRHVFEAAADAGVRQGVHISSLAVIKPGHEVGGILDEATPLDAGHARRGPYVWGKAESELLVAQLARRAQPGHQDRPSGSARRLRRLPSAGPARPRARAVFVAIGGKKTPLSVCDVGTAGRVIRSYVEDFAAAPPLVNLVEAPPPTRGELADRFKAHRPDLRVLLVPGLAAAGARRPAEAGAADRARQQAAGRRLRGVRQRALSDRCRRRRSSSRAGASSIAGGAGMSDAPRRPRAVLMCHAESRLNREGVARWLGSFTDLVGMVVIDERGQHTKVRVRKEIERIGWLRFLDVLAFRAYYGLVLDRRDSAWVTRTLDDIAARYPAVPGELRAARDRRSQRRRRPGLPRAAAPDLMVARCKRILKERIFAVPRAGTYVLHPGICPEYRNAHGCFWALARRDLDKVGLTLLRIDKGVDTGPVYGYFTYPFDEVTESHIVVMTRVVTDNLDAIRDRLLDAVDGRATAIDTTGRPSGVWGQPWLTRYLAWKRAARRRRHARAVARVPRRRRPARTPTRRGSPGPGRPATRSRSRRSRRISTPSGPRRGPRRRARPTGSPLPTPAGRCSSPSTTAASAPSAASPTPSSAAAGAATSS